MRRLAFALGIANCACWFAVGAAVLVVVGVREWWLVVAKSAAHGHLRFAAAAVLVVVLPVVLTATFAWCWRRTRGWVAYCLAVALAVVTPAMVVPRLAHLVPPLGWVALVVLELIGVLSAYAVARRATRGALSYKNAIEPQV